MLSNELLLARAGNFTASENHRLMAGWDRVLPPPSFEFAALLCSFVEKLGRKPLVKDVKEAIGFSFTGAQINEAYQYVQIRKIPAGLISYAEEKALEEYCEPDPSLNFSTVHTRNGEEREAECMLRLADSTGVFFTKTGDDQTHIHSDQVGCTPDGVALDDLDLIFTGAEVKCKSPREHLKNIMIKDGDQMKAEAFDHFTQIQTALLVTACEYWYFANFNPYFIDPSLQFHFIRVYRDEPFIKILRERVKIAKKIKAEYATKIDQRREELAA